jgi:hypothetical protein
MELRQVSIATTPRPLVESQEGFPDHRLTRLPGREIGAVSAGIQEAV